MSKQNSTAWRMLSCWRSISAITDEREIIVQLSDVHDKRGGGEKRPFTGFFLHIFSVSSFFFPFAFV